MRIEFRSVLVFLARLAGSLALIAYVVWVIALCLIIHKTCYLAMMIALLLALFFVSLLAWRKPGIFVSKAELPVIETSPKQ